MKIAIATHDYTDVAGHAGQARHWLVYDSDSGAETPQRLELAKGEVLHHWKEDGPHPLEDVSVIVAGSAGDAFVRRMARRGVEVLLTSERDASRALTAVLDGEVLAAPDFNPALLLCRLRDLFSKH
ncbi:hypothetical protein Thimo_0117 [Thioflavicoccus mobilis 8321]|uniref:Uncharacterized protein n=1 Tax=Thioflavicoccus mobilis 8321 TaxID=765912 RepID=L0GT64_9GAMM|nr:NifB/NifX family molybdenum-iron cluster-binding protein [Thioflavicoccus mobilis]AGA88992.1 hypothetical protein Thimo_0117 [Thioflavicoccus mobilis 8321]